MFTTYMVFVSDSAKGYISAFEVSHIYDTCFEDNDDDIYMCVCVGEIRDQLQKPC